MGRRPKISSLLLLLMAQQDGHAWTLDDLQAGLAGLGAKADFSTIYRAAEKLVAGGVARKVLIDDGRARFELAGAHHDHLHCTNCDDLIAVPCVVNRDAYAAIETAIGAAILDHRVVLTGLCPKCAARAP